ncbi:MAG: hypothetical protein ACJ76P_08340 [Actinomycetota bacterium]
MGESDDLRTFIREITLRFERGMERISREIRADVAETRKENRRYFEAIRAQQLADRERLDEVLAESRAGRDALFRILDRLDNGGPAAEPG